MKRKIRIKNIIILSSIITALGLLVFFDHQRVTNDFINLRADLMRVRLGTITENNSVIVKFDEDQMSVFDFGTSDLIEAKKYPTINEVSYDTKIGKNTIVFHRGTTELFNERVHGGEIELKSWFGFKKYIHVNCAGFVSEGRYPED